MKRLAFAAIVLSSVIACGPREDAALDTTSAAPAMAPAPAAPADTMLMDTTQMMDTTMMDTTATPPPAQ